MVATQGIKSTFLVGSESRSRTAGAIRLTERAYAPKARTDTHAHDYACLDFVLAGSVNETYKDRARHATAGRLLYYAPQAEHAWSSGGNGLVILHSIIPLSLIEEWDLAQRTNDRQFSSCTAAPMAHRLFYEFRVRDTASALSIDSLCTEMLAGMLQPGDSESSRPQWLSTIEAMLGEHQGSVISLTELAATVRVHPGHLARTFRSVHRMTPGQYLRRCRLADAARRVLEDSESLSSIAYRSGFSDQSHFTREFRRYVGCSPRQYRRTCKLC